MINFTDYLNYDKSTGVFVWVDDFSPRAREGAIAGTVGIKGNGNLKYRSISIRKKRYMAHRIAYCIGHGLDIKDIDGHQIDHINGDSLDNRLVNLRLVSNSENMKNRSIYACNKIGIAGVYKSDSGRFLARIRAHGKLVTVCSTMDFFEACCSRKSAERKYGFNINHCNR